MKPDVNGHTLTNAAAPRRSSAPTLSAVLPAYNEAANLLVLLPQLRATLEGLTPQHEILVVDDGSRDATADILRLVADRRLRHVRLSRNFGKEAALSAGLARADGQVVVLMDADGQHPPELITPMLQAWRDGADVVCAVRKARADESWLKRIGSRWFYRLVNSGSSVRIPADVGDFRLMDRQVVDALNALPERNRFMKGLYAWVGFETRVLPYLPAERRQGKSHFSAARLAALALTGITAFSTLPLRIWSAIGGLVAMVSLSYGAVIVIDVLVSGHPLPGWPTLGAGIMFFGGVQLLSIGVLGEYVSRIFDEVKQRPLYVVGHDSGKVLPLQAASGDR